MGFQPIEALKLLTNFCEKNRVKMTYFIGI